MMQMEYQNYNFDRICQIIHITYIEYVVITIYNVYIVITIYSKLLETRFSFLPKFGKSKNSVAFKSSKKLFDLNNSSLRRLKFNANFFNIKKILRGSFIYFVK